MRKILFSICLLGIYSIANAQSPSSLPSPYSPTGYYSIGWIRSDSGFIPAQRDTSLRARYLGTMVFWPQPGFDSSFWFFNGSKYVKEFDTQDTLPGRPLVTKSFLISQSYLSNITGLISQGANVTITGGGTLGNPYVISSSGGSGGIISLNGLTSSTQLFQTGTSGSDFNINSSGSTHTFNFPSSGPATRGLLTSTDWSTFNNKQPAITLTTSGTSGAATFSSATLNIPQYQGQITLTTTGTSGAATFLGNVLNIPQYSGGGGNTNSNIGSGYRLAVPSTNNVKTIFGSLLLIDSTTNTNALTLLPDTTTGNQKLATQGFISRNYQPIGAYQNQLNGTGYILQSGTSSSYIGGSATNLIGYNSSGTATAIVLGSGLSMSGNTLSSSGGGGLSPIANRTYLGNISGSTAIPIALNMPFINVLDFGAVADSVTDNRSAFINALAALSNGGTLYIPAGAKPYLISDSIIIPKNIRILGDGGADVITNGNYAKGNAASTIVVTNATKSGLVFNSPGCTISLIKIRNTATSPTAGSGIVSNAGNLSLANVSVQGFYNNIVYNDAQLLTLQNVSSDDFVKHGIEIRNLANQDAGDINLDNVTCTSSAKGDTTQNAAIYWESSGGLKINNLKIVSGGTTLKYGIVFNQIGAPTSIFEMTNSSIENTLNIPVLANFSSFKYFMISNCEINASVVNYNGPAISLSGSGVFQFISIHGNHLIGPGTTSAAIKITNASNVYLFGNASSGFTGGNYQNDTCISCTNTFDFVRQVMPVTSQTLNVFSNTGHVGINLNTDPGVNLYVNGTTTLTGFSQVGSGSQLNSSAFQVNGIEQVTSALILGPSTTTRYNLSFAAPNFYFDNYTTSGGTYFRSNALAVYNAYLAPSGNTILGNTLGNVADNSTGQLQVLSTTQAQLALEYSPTVLWKAQVNSSGVLNNTGLTGLTYPTSAFPTGTTTDSVLVETTSSGIMTIKKVAQSSIGGGGAVSSVSNSDGTLTISPTTGAVVASLALGHANTWSGTQTFGNLTTTGTVFVTSLSSSGANDSVLTVDPTTGQLHRRSGNTALFVANGLTFAGGDSIYLGGTLNKSTTLANGGFSISFTGSGLVNLASPTTFGTATTSDANYTVGNESQIILSNFISANRSLILPTASANTGRILFIRNTQFVSTNTFTWSPSSTIYDASGIGISYFIKGSSYIIMSDGTNWNLISVVNAQGQLIIQSGSTITSGTSGTLANATNVYIDPTSTIASYVATFPANPTDGTVMKIHFGGQISSGAVVTSFTLNPNTGQTIVQGSAPTTGNAGDCLIYQYAVVNGSPRWYREK